MVPSRLDEVSQHSKATDLVQTTNPMHASMTRKIACWNRELSIYGSRIKSIRYESIDAMVTRTTILARKNIAPPTTIIGYPIRIAPGGRLESDIIEIRAVKNTESALNQAAMLSDRI